MGYKEELIEKIKDSEKWPDFERPDFLGELDDIADNAYSKGTIEGYLAALLIYQQLVEEMLKIFLKEHEFFIQLSVFPAEIRFSEKSKTMFGRLIDELKNTISMDNSKEEIIKLSNELNKIRIELVHGLTKLSDLDLIEKKVKEAKDKFDELYTLFYDEHEKFRLIFKDFRKDRLEVYIDE